MLSWLAIVVIVLASVNILAIVATTYFWVMVGTSDFIKDGDKGDINVSGKGKTHTLKAGRLGLCALPTAIESRHSVLGFHGATGAPAHMKDEVLNDFLVTQNAHGFVVGKVVTNLTGATWSLATASNAVTVAVVAAVFDENTFSVRTQGHIGGLEGLTPGTVYYVDSVTPGQITTTPTTLSVLVALTKTDAFVRIQMIQSPTVINNYVDNHVDADPTAAIPSPDYLDLFVSSTGSDTTNDGVSYVSPFATIGRAFQAIRETGYNNACSITIMDELNIMNSNISTNTGVLGKQLGDVVIRGVRTSVGYDLEPTMIGWNPSTGFISVGSATVAPQQGQIVTFTSGPYANVNLEGYLGNISGNEVVLPVCIGEAHNLGSIGFSENSLIVTALRYDNDVLAIYTSTAPSPAFQFLGGDSASFISGPLHGLALGTSVLAADRMIQFNVPGLNLHTYFGKFALSTTTAVSITGSVNFIGTANQRLIFQDLAFNTSNDSLTNVLKFTNMNVLMNTNRFNVTSSSTFLALCENASVKIRGLDVFSDSLCTCQVFPTSTDLDVANAVFTGQSNIVVKNAKILSECIFDGCHPVYLSTSDVCTLNAVHWRGSQHGITLDNHVRCVATGCYFEGIYTNAVYLQNGSYLSLGVHSVDNTEMVTVYRLTTNSRLDCLTNMESATNTYCSSQYMTLDQSNVYINGNISISYMQATNFLNLYQSGLYVSGNITISNVNGLSTAVAINMTERSKLECQNIIISDGSLQHGLQMWKSSVICSHFVVHACAELYECVAVHDGSTVQCDSVDISYTVTNCVMLIDYNSAFVCNGTGTFTIDSGTSLGIQVTQSSQAKFRDAVRFPIISPILTSIDVTYNSNFACKSCTIDVTAPGTCTNAINIGASSHMFIQNNLSIHSADNPINIAMGSSLNCDYAELTELIGVGVTITDKSNISCQEIYISTDTRGTSGVSIDMIESEASIQFLEVHMYGPIKLLKSRLDTINIGTGQVAGTPGLIANSSHVTCKFMYVVPTPHEYSVAQFAILCGSTLNVTSDETNAACELANVSGTGSCLLVDTGSSAVFNVASLIVSNGGTSKAIQVSNGSSLTVRTTATTGDLFRVNCTNVPAVEVIGSSKLVINSYGSDQEGFAVSQIDLRHGSHMSFYQDNPSHVKVGSNAAVTMNQLTGRVATEISDYAQMYPEMCSCVWSGQGV